MATELQKWLDTAKVSEAGEFQVPHNVIKAMMALSVTTNWPRYEVAHTDDGDPIVLKFGDAGAANKALEMLAKAEGLMDNPESSRPAVEIHLHGIDTEALK